MTEGRACEFRSQRSARTKSIDAVESSGACTKWPSLRGHGVAGDGDGRGVRFSPLRVDFHQGW